MPPRLRGLPRSHERQIYQKIKSRAAAKRRYCKQIYGAVLLKVQLISIDILSKTWRIAKATMSNLTHPNSKRGLDFAHVALNLATQWQGPVIIKLRSYRALVLSGLETFRSDALEVPQATGFIELIGPRSGTAATSLLIGFSNQDLGPVGTFELRSNEAVGTLILPGKYFTSWLEIAKAPNAHFRIGGDGQRNALASDAALLHF